MKAAKRITKIIFRNYKPKLNPISIVAYFLFIFSLPFISIILCFFFIIYSFLNKSFGQSKFAIDYILFFCKSNTFVYPDLMILFILVSINLFLLFGLCIKYKFMPLCYELRKLKKSSIINAKQTYNEITLPIIMIFLSLPIIMLCFTLSLRESYYGFSWCDLVDVYRFASNIIKVSLGTINYKWENTCYKKENNIIVEKNSPSIFESFLYGGYEKLIII